MRILTILPLWLIAFSASAQLASKANQSNNNDLAGIWQTDHFGSQMTMMLNPDGSGEFDGEMIRYTAKSGVLSIIADNETNNYKYVLNGNSLTVSGGDLDQAVTFTKGSTTSPDRSMPNSSGGIKDLIGVWSGNGENLEFNTDGTCIYLGKNFRYQVANGEITLITRKGIAVFGYAVKGTQLTLSANGKQVVYNRGTSGNALASGPKNIPQELAGKWCWVNVTNTNSGGSSSGQCITLNADGTYTYYSERSMSVNDPSFAAGTNSQGSDAGTWWVQGDRIFYNSQTRGQGSYSLEKRNHPKNANDPMIVLDGQPYVTQYQKMPWR
jgi:hypothetical protein